MTKSTQTKPAQSDAKRLQTVLDILGINANRLAKVLEYKSPGTVYHVLSGTNQMSPQMMTTIIEKFPRINYLYLKTGKGEPILKTDSEVQSQQNLFGHVAKSYRSTEKEEKEETPKSPEDSGQNIYLVHQLQMMISATNENNRLLKELLDETKSMHKTLQGNN